MDVGIYCTCLQGQIDRELPEPYPSLPEPSPYAPGSPLLVLLLHVSPYHRTELAWTHNQPGRTLFLTTKHLNVVSGLICAVWPCTGLGASGFTLAEGAALAVVAVGAWGWGEESIDKGSWRDELGRCMEYGVVKFGS